MNRSGGERLLRYGRRVTDYCGCGYSASMLCRVCRRPTCTAVAPEHRAVLANIDMGHGVVLDVKAEHWNGQGVCPDCIHGLAAREYQEFIRPLIGINGDTAFEKACVAAYLRQPYRASQFPQSQAVRSPRKGLLCWSTVEWRGPFLSGMSAGDFAREFASAASRRHLQSHRVKLSTFSSIDVFEISSVDREMGNYPELWVAADGSGLFDCTKYGDKYPVPHSPDTPMQIPMGAAGALGLSPSP